GRAMRPVTGPVTGPVMRPVAGPGHGTWSWDLSGKDAPTARRNAGPLGPARRNVVRTMPFCQYATAIAVENCQQKRPAPGRPFCSAFAQPWRRIGALPELIVHAEPDDVDLVACCRARSADRGATGGIAKIGIKIFDLRRPGSENCVFDAEARGPAGPIGGCGHAVREHLDIAERAACGEVGQCAIKGITDPATRGGKPAGLDLAAGQTAKAGPGTGRTSDPAAGGVAFKAEDEWSALHIESDCSAHQAYCGTRGTGCEAAAPVGRAPPISAVSPEQ